MERKWIERNYHVQDNASVELKDVKIIVTQINSQHYPSVVHITNLMAQWGMGKNYHLRFDPKLGMGVCAIRCIPCTCVACTKMMDKPCIFGIPCHQVHLLASIRIFQQLEHYPIVIKVNLLRHI